ncbi:hypothetical protein HYE68_007363 [Fusarium pseudograminearum]|nr:hypothetical protein HYE68_007363 [Fusarium pseudograminearum]
MKEDLNIMGNEYTYMLMCYTIATAIMQIPSNAIALKVRPRYWIVACEIGWTIFTFAQAAATSPKQMYAFRFMIGFFESDFSSIVIFLLGSRYNKSELTKLCGCMSLPVALSVWWLLSDLPHNTQAWYITEEKKALALRCCALQGKVQVTGKLDLASAKRTFTHELALVDSLPDLYLRENGYSVSRRYIIPGCANLVSMLTDFTWSFMPDYTQSRVYWMVGPIMCTIVVGSSILTAWPPSDAARVADFFLTASG